MLDGHIVRENVKESQITFAGSWRKRIDLSFVTYIPNVNSKCIFRMVKNAH